MANIVVEYEGIPAIAREMRSQGQELNSELVSAYNSITNMHNVWYGKRYNDLCLQFNNIIVNINSLLDLVVGQVPFTLETVANNYSQADAGMRVTSAVRTEPNRITDIAIINDVGMKFVTAEVETVKTTVTNNFANSKAKMTMIEGTFNKITWQSEASEAFRAQFSSLKASIMQSFDNLENQFSTLMAQTLEDIQNTENANTVE